MALYLVRHAVAVGRSSWDGHDEARPLTAKGERQSKALRSLLAHADVRRIYSSPAVRCVDTVAPIAAAHHLEVRSTPVLAEGRGAGKAVDLLLELAGKKGDSMACTHGDVIPEALRHLAREGLVLQDDLQFAKGSTWEITVDHDKLTTARYHPPAE